MANEEHLVRLKQGVEVWNKWRHENDFMEPDLSRAGLHEADLREANLSGANLIWAHLNGANLSRANLRGANLSRANLRGANLRGAHLDGAYLDGANLDRAYLSEANLSEADLSWANLSGAHLNGANLSRAGLHEADLREANLREANLRRADLRETNLREADLRGADLRGAHLDGANLSEANLSEAYLSEANLSGANLSGANLTGANLRGANLTGATLARVLLTSVQLVETNLTNANLTGCHIYGVSAWNLTLEGVQQRDLIITRYDEPEITVDNLEVAQFIYLLLNNKKIRDVIDTITSKAVLILGRFTSERKAVLDAIREELRLRDYLPIVFDFDKPVSKDLTGTVETLARMARFIIADLTDPSSIPHELATIVPFLRTTPVLSLRLVGSGGYSMFEDLRAYPWVLQTHEYQDSPSLISALPAIIDPADKMVDELRSRS